MKNIEEANTNPFPKNLPLKQSNTTTHFQKLFFSDNQTQQPKRNNEINKPKQTQDPPRVLLGSNRTWVLLELLGSDRNYEKGFVGVDRIKSVALSHFVLFHISRSPPKLTWVLLESDCTLVLLELSFARVC